MIDYQFPPNGIRGRAIDCRMRRMLAESLEHIATQARGHIPFDAAALDRLVEGLKAGERYPPSAFAIYTELVLALLDGRNDEAQSLIVELTTSRPRDQSWRLLALDDPAIADHIERYKNLMYTDPKSNFGILPPSPGIASGFRERFNRSYDLMVSAVPELAAEFDALVSEVVMVVGEPGASYQFDGGSSYMLWGGLFLNASSHHSEVALIEAIAHESAHSLLFGFASDETLVTNPDDELYDSPLRNDPRPMDGIYHATYVSARMHWAMSQLIRSEMLDEAARTVAESARRADQENFEAGYAVVKRHGTLTQTGEAVLRGARAYMDGVESVFSNAGLRGSQ